MTAIGHLYIYCWAFLSVAITALNLTLLHTNDVHARYEQTNAFSGICSDQQASEGKCYGGFARLKTVIDEIRTEYGDEVLLLDAGDQYQGTLWFNHFGGTITSYFMNWLGYDAMALGNHEFDRSIAGLVPFLDNVTFPVLSANIDGSPEPTINGKFTKSTTKIINGVTVGIIGYTTATTRIISVPGELIFSEEVAAVQQEADKLKLDGVDIIIALGHAGISVDTKIAQEVQGVDVVIGGHSNTFLYTGPPPDRETPAGEYPTVVVQSDGATVLVVQAFAYTKYLGFLQVSFDNNGHLTSWDGNPLSMDKSILRDNATLEALAPWKQKLSSSFSNEVGKTNVLLDGDRNHCRLRECNMGNLITDAMVHQNMRHPDDIRWNSVSIALINSGGIRSSLERGPITIGDLMIVQPFRNYVDIVELKGEHLLGALEWSVFDINDDDPAGKFLQMSGLRVKYSLSKPNNHKVISVMTLCTECLIPEFVPLVLNKTYEVIVMNFIRDGGDGYDVIKNNYMNSHELGDLDVDILVEYVTAFSPIYQKIEGRITFVDEEDTVTTPCQTEEHTSTFTADEHISTEPVTHKPCECNSVSAATRIGSAAFTLMAAWAVVVLGV